MYKRQGKAQVLHRDVGKIEAQGPVGFILQKHHRLLDGVPRLDEAQGLSLIHISFCPDVDQGGGWTVGTLADELRRSTVWYFWWD